MQKFLLLPIFIALNVITLTCYAQDFYSTNKDSAPSTAAPTAPASKSMSPEEFKAKMESNAKMTDDYLTKHVEDVVKKGQDESKIEAPSISGSSSGTSAVDKAAAQMNEDKKKQDANVTTSKPAAPANPTPATKPAANPQPYTGFGSPQNQGGNSGQGQGQGQSQGDGNWNVGY